MWLLTSSWGRSLLMFGGGLLLAVGIYVSFMVWLAAHDRNVLDGYVKEVRATAAEAKLVEAQRQLTGQQIVIDAYQLQYKNVLAANAERDQQDEADIKEREATNATAGKATPYLDDDDLKFLRK